MARPKKVAIIEEVVTTIEPEVIEVVKEVEEKRNFPIMMKETKEVKCIKKSEYNYLIHTCL